MFPSKRWGFCVSVWISSFMVKTDGIVGSDMREQLSELKLAQRCHIRACEPKFLNPLGLGQLRWAAISLLNLSFSPLCTEGDNSAFADATLVCFASVPLWRPHWQCDPQPINVNNSFCVQSPDRSLPIGPLKIREIRVSSGLSWRLGLTRIGLLQLCRRSA